jgi:glyoxylase-like metal-dependent hydrolase (beta-lactamase superfamily II)
VFWSAAILLSPGERAFAATPDTLHLGVFVGMANSWDVTSTLIYGKSEAILVDSQFRRSQAKKLSDLIVATGRHLKAIIITHPDYDHYTGTAVLHERFPETPIYRTADALEEFKRTSNTALNATKASTPSETPDSLPTPQALPTTILSVDGETVVVIKDFQGDGLKATNSFLWIPSLRAVVAGDIVFSGVHVWLGDSTPESRRAWLDSLQLIAALRPRVVVAGHKKNPGVPDSPRAVTSMEKYLHDFESARKASSSADELVAVMERKFPGWSQERLLVFSAKAAILPAANATSDRSPPAGSTSIQQ